jgi:hypothetical protein
MSADCYARGTRVIQKRTYLSFWMDVLIIGLKSEACSELLRVIGD